MLFRMVPKLANKRGIYTHGFRVMLFRMVPKLSPIRFLLLPCFRVMLFRMVPKQTFFYRLAHVTF